MKDHSEMPLNPVGEIKEILLTEARGNNPVGFLPKYQCTLSLIGQW
jgi:hypothetical protein